MARNLGHSAEGVAGSEIIASLKIQLKNSYFELQILKRCWDIRHFK